MIVTDYKNNLDNKYPEDEKLETYFETIKCFDEEILNLGYHKKRISDTIGKNFNLEEYIYPPTNQLLKCNIIYNQDEILDIKYTQYKSRTINSFKLIYDNTINYKYKSLNRDYINKLFSKKDNTDEIIIIKNGLVTDTSIANIAIMIQNQWYTPKIPLLNGTTRARYINDQILKEKDITIDILKKAEKMALLNAMIDFKVLDEYKIIEE